VCARAQTYVYWDTQRSHSCVCAQMYVYWDASIHSLVCVHRCTCTGTPSIHILVCVCRCTCTGSPSIHSLERERRCTRTGTPGIHILLCACRCMCTTIRLCSHRVESTYAHVQCRIHTRTCAITQVNHTRPSMSACRTFSGLPRDRHARLKSPDSKYFTCTVEATGMAVAGMKHTRFQRITAAQRAAVSSMAFDCECR
jgi:hypothetical protein